MPETRTPVGPSRLAGAGLMRAAYTSLAAVRQGTRKFVPSNATPSMRHSLRLAPVVSRTPPGSSTEPSDATRTAYSSQVLSPAGTCEKKTTKLVPSNPTAGKPEVCGDTMMSMPSGSSRVPSWPMRAARTCVESCRHATRNCEPSPATAGLPRIASPPVLSSITMVSPSGRIGSEVAVDLAGVAGTAASPPTIRTTARSDAYRPCGSRCRGPIDTPPLPRPRYDVATPASRGEGPAGRGAKARRVGSL